MNPLKAFQEEERVCNDCKEKKPLSQFYSNRRLKDGKNRHCKQCSMRRISEWKKKHGYKTRHRPGYFEEESTIQKQKARYEARKAIARNALKKTDCVECGSPKTEAHHHNGYEQENWLDVVFLCRKHHVSAHKELSLTHP